MNDEAKKARAEYAREYRVKNRERLNEYRRKWNHEHPEKVRQYNEDYWMRKIARG